MLPKGTTIKLNINNIRIIALGEVILLVTTSPEKNKVITENKKKKANFG